MQPEIVSSLWERVRRRSIISAESSHCKEGCGWKSRRVDFSWYEEDSEGDAKMGFSQSRGGIGWKCMNGGSILLRQTDSRCPDGGCSQLLAILVR